MSFEPVTKIGQVRVIHAEDSSYLLEEFATATKWLVGVSDENYHSFPELDEAYSFLQESDKETPTVLLLDNQTPPSGWEGISLAKKLLREKEEYPNLIVVTITSSDMGLAFDEDGIQITKLQDVGGEFWAKHQERHLCLLWLGDCLRQGKTLPRKPWLEKLGIKSSYTDSTEGQVKENWAIFSLVDSLKSAEKHGDPNEILAEMGMEKGVFFKEEAPEVLAKLGFPGRGIEGKPSTIESE